MHVAGCAARSAREPAPLRRAALAAADLAAVRVQHDHVPGSERVAVPPRSRQPEAVDRDRSRAGVVLVVPERGLDARHERAPARVEAVREVGPAAALVGDVAEHGDRPGDRRDERGRLLVAVDAHEAMSPTAMQRRGPRGSAAAPPASASASTTAAARRALVKTTWFYAAATPASSTSAIWIAFSAAPPRLSLGGRARGRSATPRRDECARRARRRSRQRPSASGTRAAEDADAGAPPQDARSPPR